MTETTDTAEIARAYFDAWTNRRGPDALRPLMAENYKFDAGAFQIEGREAFLAAAAGGWPQMATTSMMAEGYDGEHGFQLYIGVNGEHTVKVVEHLVVRDRRIVSSEIVTDGAVFAAFMAG